MQQFEVEIKSLLGGKENADALIARMKEIDTECVRHSSNSQLNHYFTGGELSALVQIMEGTLSGEGMEKLKDLTLRAKESSVRTRKKDEEVILVVKASVGSDSSSNGVSRIEFEEKLPISLDELDAKVLSAGFSYQAKWSRDREEYTFKGITVCLDHNAGYGYLAEFEKVVDEESAVDSARKEVESIMNELAVAELPQDRLERMFAHYNQNWQEYYGTDKIFVIE